MVESITSDAWYLSPYRSDGLSLDLKRAILVASPSVVSIRGHLGETKFRDGSGFVVESTAINGKFISTVLTSASIVRAEFEDALASDIKVTVILSNEITCEGLIYACDFHFNVAVIKIEADDPITIVRLRNVNTVLNINHELGANLSEFDTHSGNFNLVPGVTVVALGRSHYKRNEIKAVDGIFSADETDLDCQELLKADLIFPRNGIGGPLINGYGEVIGMNFYDDSFTPFLPINIVSMCWEQLEKKGHYLLPRLGLKLFNLYSGNIAYLESLLRRFPNTFKGVAVNEITLAAPAYSPEILPDDVIVGCNGIPVGNILELFKVIRDKVGEAVYLHVLRPSDGSHMQSMVVVSSIGPDHINRWPVSKPRKRLRMIAWA